MFWREKVESNRSSSPSLIPPPPLNHRHWEQTNILIWPQSSAYNVTTSPTTTTSRIHQFPLSKAGKYFLVSSVCATTHGGEGGRGRERVLYRFASSLSYPTTKSNILYYNKLLIGQSGERRRILTSRPNVELRATHIGTHTHEREREREREDGIIIFIMRGKKWERGWKSSAASSVSVGSMQFSSEPLLPLISWMSLSLFAYFPLLKWH